MKKDIAGCNLLSYRWHFKSKEWMKAMDVKIAVLNVMSLSMVTSLLDYFLRLFSKYLCQRNYIVWNTWNDFSSSGEHQAATLGNPVRVLSTPPGISMTSAQCIRGWDSSFCHFVQFRFVETHLFMLADSIFKILLTFPENLLCFCSCLPYFQSWHFQGPSFIPAFHPCFSGTLFHPCLQHWEMRWQRIALSLSGWTGENFYVTTWILEWNK